MNRETDIKNKSGMLYTPFIDLTQFIGIIKDIFDALYELRYDVDLLKT